MTIFEELTPPYATIVVDPPWHYGNGAMTPPDPLHGVNPNGHPLPYSALSLGEIQSLPVGDLADSSSRLFLWVTNRYLRYAWEVIESWGFIPGGRVFVWCKPRRATMTITTEFIVTGKRGRPAPLPWCGTTWFNWPRQPNHSQKPDAFLDLVEQWSPGPYVELFSRTPRLGWDSWGHGYELGEVS